MRKDNRFLVLYHGALTTGRGIETLIKQVSLNDLIYGVILGDGEINYVEFLHALAEKYSVSDRVLFHPAVPISDLYKYVGAVDLCLMMIQGKVKSYYYSLPNKFFESIQSLTPIVASDFPEMKRIIDYYQIGLTCNPNDSNAIKAAVNKMRTDNEFYNKCKINLIRAKNEMCWEKEKVVLVNCFERLLVD